MPPKAFHGAFPCRRQGYYRRGDANFALGKFKLAARDFRLAAKVAPRDPDLRKKLAECEREVKRIRFEEALAMPVRCAGNPHHAGHLHFQFVKC